MAWSVIDGDILCLDIPSNLVNDEKGMISITLSGFKGKDIFVRDFIPVELFVET